MIQLETLNQTVESLTSGSAGVQEIINSSLFGPIRDLMGRPAKNVRASLVHAGYLFVKPQGGDTICAALSDALEAIHAGSLIIDDIQDGSRERRGSPSLHETYGVPLALNAGNFLYFQPFAWIESLGLSERIELRLYRLCHEAMLNAHIGQAIDLGAEIAVMPSGKVEDVCQNSSRFKTGALTALALTCGAVLAGATDDQVRALKKFGENFGIALQRFDDIGNSALPETDAKRFEDLLLRRPSWVWALAARRPKNYRAFVSAVSALPDDDLLTLWLERENFFAFAQSENERFLNETLASFKADPACTQIVTALGEKLKGAYGK